jgi:hypothetical protein
MWGGTGTGSPCSLCDKPIEEAEIEIEQRVNGKVHTYHFHVLCESLWQLECVRDYHLKNRPLNRSGGLNETPPEGVATGDGTLLPGGRARFGAGPSNKAE